MSSNAAIRISNLSKCYSIRTGKHHRSTNLAEAFVNKLRRPFERIDTEEFWALKDVQLEIKQGEVVGVIGRNGAGKSTLLKVLSRITEPTTGRVELFGRVGSLLEVGTGFHPELTGRENIFLNGAILGMRRPEIKKQFDAIVEFAGVEKFLDTPVKRYSSGMYVRLAFAVAAHLNPEILIIDEVLAVGDADFQKKCMGKMHDVAKSGRTVLFVSHNLAAVENLCDVTVLLESGQVRFTGGVGEGIARFLKCENPDKIVPPERRQGSGEFRVEAVSSDDKLWASDGKKTFVVDYVKVRDTVMTPFVVVEVCNSLSQVAARLDTRLVGKYLTDARGKLKFSLRSPWLTPGDYYLKIYIDSGFGFVDIVEHALPRSISADMPYDYTGRTEAYMRGLVLSDFEVLGLANT